ncbi:MAG: pyridoxal phosphate-dependent aminotransferase [candidate division WOR-3 bacterium]|nr:pyridoxal phosphate-dependent aminotransferase [candidate division WOR-3 bacterium]
MKNYDVCYPGQDISQNLVPQFCDKNENQIPESKYKRRDVWPSKMFTIKLELDEFTRNNPHIPVYDASQGDGGMSLGGIPKEEIAEALLRYLPEERTTKYGEPNGSLILRRAIYENYYKFDSETGLTPENIVIGDGGRDILQKWYQAISQEDGGSGDFILVSAAPWGSYPEGSYINGFNMVCAPGNPDNAFKITPEGIDISIEFVQKYKRKITGIIITSPDNPTGNYLSEEEMLSLIEHAVAKGIKHIFVDLIYQAVTDLEIGCYNVNNIYKNLSPEAKMRVCFMDGLTKKAGASNIRNAHLVCGSIELAKKIKGIATHTVLPNVAGEAVAYEIYRQESPIEHPWVKRVIEPTAKSRTLVKKRLKELGFKFICDQGYYAFINIYPWLGKEMPKEKILIDETGRKIKRIENVEILKSYLSAHCGLAVIHGSVFRQPHFIRFSYANTPEYTDGAITRLEESLRVLR